VVDFKSRNISKRILVIEDNELNLKFFNDLLVYQGFDVIKMQDASEIANDIVEYAKNGDFNLIIMDIQLKGFSGLDFIFNLKQSHYTRNIPIFAVTAFAMKSDEKKIMSSGCDALISKPISIQEFLSTVERLLNVVVSENSFAE
jgi:two-component system cell cycle response regulator DivK